MEEDNKKILQLKEKKARLISQLDALADANDSFYVQLGKVVAQIHFLEKKILQNNYDDSQI